ncbi:general amino acid permease agp2 [Kluyveromyces marxianus]|nr:general amino acid permease agp2 [Kluyveromyces marxianus]
MIGGSNYIRLQQQTSGDGKDLMTGSISLLSKQKAQESEEVVAFSSDDSSGYFRTSTARSLKNYHVQLIGISGVIGTALFVSIGKALYHGGALSLIFGFALWCIPILCITVSTAEMVCYLPISSPFLRMSKRCCNDSMAVMAGWNFWFLECVQIPFEIVAVNTILHYWRDDFSPAIPLCIQVVLYVGISLFAVRYYGETEAFLASFKILLAVGLFLFTFITMLGANPKHDRYGFRNITTTKFKKYFPNGEGSESIGYFQGFLACIIQASFTIAGPDYVAMIAGETMLPRKVLPTAFKQVFIRLTILFLGGCLCVGIVCSSKDPALTAVINEPRPGAGSSPYVIAMNNLGIKVLPDVVNAALVTAAFSAGNAYTYCSSRSLYGLSLDGYAPRVFQYCTKSGVPIFAVAVSLVWALISLLQLSSNSAVVLNWLINLITASQLINFAVLCIIYLSFRRAYIAQYPSKSLPELPFKSWGQPYTCYCGLTAVTLMIGVQGYTVFLRGNWDVENFLFCYLMVFVDIAIFLGCFFVFKRAKDPWVKLHEADLLTGIDEIEEHEKSLGFHKYALNSIQNC